MHSSTPDNLVVTVFGPQLTDAGFTPMRPRKWVRDRKAPIREVFEFRALKGATYSARWGFGMDFVPLYLANAARFKWKRTNKSCEMDLCIDPIDESGKVPDWSSFMHLPGYREADMATVLRIRSQVSKHATADFDRVSSIADLVRFYETRARIEYRRFSLDNYIQARLGWGLALLALERRDEGEDQLSRFCETHGVDRNDPFLAKAVDAAREYAASEEPL